MNQRIRRVYPDDLAAVLALYEHLHSNDDPLPAPEQVAAVWEQIVAGSYFHCFVVERDQRLIATALLTIVPNLTRGMRPYGLVENVVTDPAVQRQGVGTALLKDMLQFAWQQHCYKVMLLTGRPQAVAFYEGAGFQRDLKIGLVAKPPADYTETSH